VSPSWSPVRSYGGYAAARQAPSWLHRCTSTLAGLLPGRGERAPASAVAAPFGWRGCDCFAF
jgi:hypothetical protein